MKNKFLNLVREYFFKLRIFKFRYFNNIYLSTTNRIYPGCRIQENYGGKISIGNGNELLYGVCLMTYGGKITIGNNCSINPYTVIYGHGNGVSIGDEVLIAGQTMIIPANHRFDDLSISINKQGIKSKGIIIENNVWIGGGCVILDGTHIGSGSIVAAGSVVNINVPNNTIVAGVPAKILKNR